MKLVPKRTFLPFEQGREYVRRLGIRSFQEWVEYSKSNQRPSFIPSNPRHTYLEHFQGYGDFLGFASRGSFTDSPSDIVPISQCRKLYSFAQGLSSFMDHMQEHAPDVEFFPLPREAAASFLIRPRGSSDDSWVPLSVRCVVEKNGKASFTGVRRNNIASMVIGFEVGERQLYHFPIHDYTPWSISVRPNSVLYRDAKIKNDAVREILLQHYEDQPRGNVSVLLDGMFKRSLDRFWIASLLSVQESVFNPLEISISFPLCTVEKVCNIVLGNDCQVLFRNVVMRETRGNRREQHVVRLERSVNKHRTPCYAHDSIDLFICVVRDPISHEIMGMYVFPKHVLSAEGYLRDPKKQIPGKQSLCIYLPDQEMWNASIERIQAWQNEHYLDLSNKSSIEKSKVQFQAMYDGVIAGIHS